MRPIRKFLAHALAATVLAAFAATGAAAADMFLKLSDIKGEAAKELHGGQIPIMSYSWGSTMAGSWDQMHTLQPGGGGGSAAGRVRKVDALTNKRSGNPGEVSQAGGVVAAGDLDGDGRPDLAASPEVVTPRDTASGMPTGKRQHRPITISKPYEPGQKSVVFPHPLERGSVTVKGSLPGCTVGAQYPDAVLQTAAARYELKEVIITSCAMPSMSGSSGGGVPTESISFNYAKIKTVYTLRSKDKSKVDVRGWDPDKKE